MLDEAIVSQLSSLYADLSAPLRLVVRPSDHAQQAELLELVQAVAATSPHLHFVEEGPPSAAPVLSLERADGTPTGLTWVGVPGGHEFTSLVLALLHADGKGKLPDDGMQARIRRLKGPADLRTYVSLSCENCPDVVQALQLVALIHGGLSHTMIVGDAVPDEVEALNLRGVPAVFVGDTMVSSGRASLASLLERLEETLGSAEADPADADLGAWDVVVVGGGPAGVASAIYTARKGLKTLVISDRLGGQLQETKGIENLIGIPYTEGPDVSAKLGEHLARFDVQRLDHRRVEKVIPDDDGPVRIELASGEHLTARALIAATGATWRKLGVPGESDYIGRGVAFCAHCDGPLFKGKDVVVVGGGNSGIEAAIDLSGLARDVTVLEFADTPKADQVLLDKIGRLPNVKLVTSAATGEVLGNDEGVTGLVYTDRASGESHRLTTDGVFVQIGLSPNSQWLADVVETTRYGEIVVDAGCRTNRPRIYAAGDVTTVPFKQIVVAMGEGAKAGLSAFEDLTLAA